MWAVNGLYDAYSVFWRDVKPELKNQIDDYCKDNNISKSEFLRRAIDVLKNS